MFPWAEALDEGRAVEALGYTHILAFDHRHLCVHTVGLGLKTPAEHVMMLEKFREEALR